MNRFRLFSWNFVLSKVSIFLNTSSYIRTDIVPLSELATSAWVEAQWWKNKILWHCLLRLWKNARCQSPGILPTSSTQTSPAHTKLQVKSRIERRMSSHFCVNKMFLQKFWIHSFFLFHFRCLKLILFYIFFRKYPQCLTFPKIFVVFVNFPPQMNCLKIWKGNSRKSETLLGMAKLR